jgi:hypothetical protein
VDKADDWKLKKIELEFQPYGEHKGKYVGSIRFQNGDFESFDFKIRPEMAQSYIDLISVDIVKAASSLGDRLIKSLGLEDVEAKRKGKG